MSCSVLVCIHRAVVPDNLDSGFVKEGFGVVEQISVSSLGASHLQGVLRFTFTPPSAKFTSMMSIMNHLLYEPGSIDVNQTPCEHRTDFTLQKTLGHDPQLHIRLARNVSTFTPTGEQWLLLPQSCVFSGSSASCCAHNLTGSFNTRSSDNQPGHGTQTQELATPSAAIVRGYSHST
jgi:hypothetical protein